MPLQTGERVRITYRLEGQQRDRVTVATFLARIKDDHRDELVLSGRPAYGTSNLPVGVIKSIKRVDLNTEPHQPRKA